MQETYRCDDCGHEWQVNSKEKSCPKCGSKKVKSIDIAY